MMRFDPRKDYWRILEVPPWASRREIEQAYRRLARKYHPDLNPSPEAQQRMAEINEAYRILRDEQARQQYERARQVYTRLPPLQSAKDVPAYVYARQQYIRQFWHTREAYTARALTLRLGKHLVRVYERLGCRITRTAWKDAIWYILRIRCPKRRPFWVWATAFPVLPLRWLPSRKEGTDFPNMIVVYGVILPRAQRYLKRHGVIFMDKKAFHKAYRKVLHSEPQILLTE